MMDDLSSTSRRQQIVACVMMIMVGCGVNVIFLEMITTRSPGSGGLITLSQFAFVSLEGLLANMSMEGGFLPTLKARTMPFWFHFCITAVFFGASLLNNMALNYRIAMPLHMVFRSSSLAASLVIGYFFMKKNYEMNQIRGVVLVSTGILVTTVAESFHQRRSSDCCDGSQDVALGEADSDEYTIWLLGLAMLTVALFASAGLGHFQEWGYRKWGKASSELKFYSHLLALPYFYAVSKNDISARIVEWNKAETLAETYPGYFDGLQIGQVPFLWILLMGNVTSQLFCISAVYKMTAVSDSLSCTLTITTRKFVSILISVISFNNPFSIFHWLGTILVFLGVAMYSGLILSSAKTKQH